MTSELLGALSWLAVALVLVLTLRRLVMVVAAVWPARKCGGDFQPSVAAVTSIRNEEVHLPGLLESLDRLDYPRDKIHFVFVNDASEDATARILKTWVCQHSNADYLEVPERIGKAQALNYGLTAVPETELVAVYDADLRPRANSLRILASAFCDPRLGAAAGYRRPSNAGKNPVTAYGALESFVHQLVTQAGKDRLGLNPTTLGGNCVYRRSALVQVGGFPVGSFSEDVEVSLALVAAGWRTRFCRGVEAGSILVESLGRYWNQRARWTRGIYRSARQASRVESWLVSAGYSDRLVFLAAIALAASGHMSLAWPALYFLAPLAAVCLALYKAGAGAKFAAYVLLCSLPMFVVDIAATLAATINALLRRRLVWNTGGTTR